MSISIYAYTIKLVIVALSPPHTQITIFPSDPNYSVNLVGQFANSSKIDKHESQIKCIKHNFQN